MQSLKWKASTPPSLSPPSQDPPDPPSTEQPRPRFFREEISDQCKLNSGGNDSRAGSGARGTFSSLARGLLRPLSNSPSPTYPFPATSTSSTPANASQSAALPPSTSVTASVSVPTGRPDVPATAGWTQKPATVAPRATPSVCNTVERACQATGVREDPPPPPPSSPSSPPSPSTLGLQARM
ncbi:hypothetical protein B0H14DRAFT_3463938 [Mycena olivaceomarginata]|nr:hypothetical protein B0H14DRAFT_3463938 [Mycena olivaceomarginata]